MKDLRARRPLLSNVLKTKKDGMQRSLNPIILPLFRDLSLRWQKSQKCILFQTIGNV